MIAGISRCTHKALCKVLVGLFACCRHSCSCLQVWGCPELPAGNKQLLISTFWVFLTDSFSPCSPGRCSEGTRSLCVAPGTLSLSELSRRGESCSRAQVQAAEGRTVHNERKLGTAPLQNQINNTFGEKKKKALEKQLAAKWTKSFPSPSNSGLYRLECFHTESMAAFRRFLYSLQINKTQGVFCIQ